MLPKIQLCLNRIPIKSHCRREVTASISLRRVQYNRRVLEHNPLLAQVAARNTSIEVHVTYTSELTKKP